MIDPQTLSQLEALKPTTRPLIVCDVDEVILHLVAPFEILLGERGMELRKKLVKLTGNVFHLSDGREATQEDIWDTLNTLFEEQAERQNPVDMASHVLEELSIEFDILLLTNLPHEYGDLRRHHLAQLNIDYPLITNSGKKGPALDWLSQQSARKMAFIDDTYHHLESVREHAPDVFLIHFMADEKFRNNTLPLDPPVLSTGDWREAGAAVQSALG